MTAWERGTFLGCRPRVLFGETYEDTAIELKAFRGKKRVFCIAAAGSASMALAEAGHLVTAVDINPAQLAYAEHRANGGTPREGQAERLLRRARGVLRLAGWSEQTARAFLELEDPSEQLAYWRGFTGLARPLMNALFSPVVLRLSYMPAFLRALPEGFGSRLSARLERCWSHHSNRENPYARNLLLGPKLESAPAVRGIDFHCADAADYLEEADRGAFDAFALSNILDGADQGCEARLLRAVKRAAAPGAVIVRRSFQEPGGEDSHNLALQDRSAIWGVVDVRLVEDSI